MIFSPSSSSSSSSSTRHLMFWIQFVLSCITNHQGISSFCLQQQQRHHHYKNKNNNEGKESSLVVYARPPPITNFDLDAIEAYETQIELERLQTTTPVVEENNDDDDIIDDILMEGQEINANDSRKQQEFIIPVELDGKRIDSVLASLIVEPTKLSRSVCGNLVTDGLVVQISTKNDNNNNNNNNNNSNNEQNNNNIVVIDRKSYKVQAGETLRVTIPNEEKPLEIIQQDLPLQILYEDEHMIVLNKAAGMVVHPAAGNWDGTVVNALAYYLANDSPYGSGDFVDVVEENKISSKDDDGSIDDDDNNNKNDPTGADGEETTISFRPGIVHRLDKGTTGVLVVAKTTQALAELSSSFAERNVKKTYMAITVGNPGKRVTIDKPIGRHPIHRQRMRVVPDPHRKNSSRMAPKDRIDASSSSASSSASKVGRRAVSHVDTLTFDGKLSLVQVRIETGRTHQIRVHLQDRHTPIYGDDIYGLQDWNKRLSKTHAIERPLLHAYRLEIGHPISGERMVFTAPLADDMKEIARTIWPQGKEERPELFE